MDIRKTLWKYRPLCVAEELARFVYHKTFGFVFEPQTPVWYNFGKPRGFVHETLPLNAAWHKIHRRLYRKEHVFYNIDNALAANPDLKGIALIFFMGIGDYLYTTPMIAALKKKYPKLAFYAYVPKGFDRNNSPIVGTLLEANPNIDKTFYFEGYRNQLVWKNYNYEAAFKDIPDNFLVMPVYYEYGQNIAHRTISLFETFGLPAPQEPAAPVFYFPKEPKAAVGEAFKKINKIAAKKKGIVFLQLDSRGSFYSYPHTDDLARKLIREGYFVITVSPSAILDEAFYKIDFKAFSFNDTCHLLNLLKKENKIYIIALNSVFWAASGGLDIPNLGLQHWVDKKVHNLWYPNITVVTDYKYPQIPAAKMIMAKPHHYTRYNKKIINYDPQFVFDSFNKMLAKEEKAP